MTTNHYDIYKDEEPRWGSDNEEYARAAKARAKWAEGTRGIPLIPSQDCSGWSEDGEFFLLRNNCDLLCVLRQDGDDFEVVWPDEAD